MTFNVVLKLKLSFFFLSLTPHTPPFNLGHYDTQRYFAFFRNPTRRTAVTTSAPPRTSGATTTPPSTWAKLDTKTTFNVVLKIEFKMALRKQRPLHCRFVKHVE